MIELIRRFEMNLNALFLYQANVEILRSQISFWWRERGVSWNEISAVMTGNCNTCPQAFETGAPAHVEVDEHDGSTRQ